MFPMPPALARLRNPMAAPMPPLSVEQCRALARMETLQLRFLGIDHSDIVPLDAAQRLDIISEERQRAAILTEGGQHARLCERMAPFDAAAFVGPDRPAELPPWERPLVIIQSEAGPAIQVFSTAVAAVTAFRTGQGLVPELKDWRSHALFGLCILRDTVIVWSAEQAGEATFDGEHAHDLLAELLPNVCAQLELVEQGASDEA